MSEPRKDKRFNLPRDFDESDRARAAALIKQRIVERTLDSIDVNGRRFANYSDSYAESFEFKLAGKSKNEPNLVLSGDMLNSIQTLESSTGYVILGFYEGTAENDKATWAERSDNGPSRKFLGLKESELELIIAEVRLDKNSLTNEEDPSVNEAIQTSLVSEQARRLLRSLNLDDDED